MKKQKSIKNFCVCFVKEENQYGLAFTEEDTGKWLAECLFHVDDPKKEVCVLSENILWRMNDLNVLGYSFVGIVRADTEGDFWSCRFK